MLMICPVSATEFGNIETVAGTGNAELNLMHGAADRVNVAQPFGVEVGPDNAWYITEVGNHRILRLDPKTEKITTVVGTGKLGYSGDNGPATKADLNEPYEVRFDKTGNMYFVEMKNHIIRKVDSKTGFITTIAGTGMPGFSGEGKQATSAQMKQPHSIAVNAAGTQLYVADIGNHRIRKIDLTTGIITTIAGTGKKGFPVDGGKAQGRPMSGPRALCLDGNNLWIALREGHSVWRLDLKNDQLHHIAGTGSKGFSGDNGPAKQATFNGPKGIALGPDGNVYVVDTENQVIRRITMATGIIDTVAGQGPRSRGPKGDGAAATSAEMDRPHGIGIAADGSLLIGDTNNHRVRRVIAK
ncbi:MAG: hypothetical protein COA78_22490 [Blastopirellula sp.]|nr:MAG: hypothetical protein COA78_22490 [Blastopirellula sp.]